MAYIDPFLAHGVSFPQKDCALLERWYGEARDVTAWGVPRLLSFEEAMDHRPFYSWFDGFPGGQAVVLWSAEHLSAIGGYYYTGPLKGCIFLSGHDAGDAGFSPRFLSLERFYSYYQRILQTYTEKGTDPDLKDCYEGRFWRHIDYNGGCPLSEEEESRFQLAARELLRIWRSGSLKEEWYEAVGCCAVDAMPDRYAEELIPYLKPERKDEYVLAVLCDKLARAHCTRAIDAMRALWAAERKGFRIGGWTAPRVAGEALRSLERVSQ